jgi:hypothetical protein
MVQKVKDYSNLDVNASVTMFLEQRMENDGDGNPIYIGYSRRPGVATSDPEWFIVKITYSAQSPTRQQLPNDGVNFTYVWDDRATYF